MMATIKVSSAAVPSSATAGSMITGKLSLATNDTAHATIDIPLTVTASGGYLTVNPSPVSLGMLAVGSTSPDVQVTLTNTGTQMVTLSFTQPSDKQFKIRWTGSPSTVSVAPGATVPGLVASFSPSNISPSNTTAGIATTDPICNTSGTPSATSIALAGQGTNGVLNLSAADIYFGTNGNVNCGSAAAAAQTLVISNKGNQAFSWVASLNKGSSSPFMFAPMSGTIPKGAMVTVTITPVAGIPAAADTSKDAFGDALQLTTDIAGDPPHTITLHQTAYGVVMAFSPTSADFGSIPIQTTSDIPFFVINTGSADAHVTLASDNGKFTVAPVGPTTVAAGTGGSETATFAPGATVTAQTANVTMALDSADVLCAPLPSALTLTGQGTNGTVSYSPAALDFGNVSCGTTATAKIVTFKNPGNQDYTITAALGLGNNSPYTIGLNPASGVVTQGGGMVVITVTPKAIPQTSAVTPDLYADVLTVTTTVTGDAAHKIPLHQTASGSIFTISTTNLDFGTVVVGASGNSTFAVGNSGNALGTLKFTTQNSVFAVPNAAVGGNASYNDIATFTPTSAGPVSDTAAITTVSGTVLCAPLPFTSMPLKGTGSVSNVITVSTGSLTFGAGGLVNCGSTATAQTISVNNTSAQTLTMTYTLALGANSPYTVSGPATLAASSSGTVTVTPKAVPTTSSTAADAFADSLKINGTGGPINEDHSVSLHETAQGAILSFNPTSLTLGPVNAITGGSDSRSFTVNNTGNIAAAYTLTVGGTDAGKFSVSPTSGSAAASGGSVSETATFTNGGLNSGTFHGTVSLATSVKLCAPLPAALTMTGSE
jgi:hypothetical protein